MTRRAASRRPSMRCARSRAQQTACSSWRTTAPTTPPRWRVPPAPRWWNDAIRCCEARVMRSISVCDIWPRAEVYSLFPADVAAARTQRTRWEQGHLALLMGTAPRQLGRALMTANVALAALMLDLLIPPLALLVVALAALVAIDGAWWWATRDAVPVSAAVAALALVTISVVAAWARYGRHLVSVPDLLRVPIYVAAKLPLYARMLARRQAEWIRTKRDEPHG